MRCIFTVWMLLVAVFLQRSAEAEDFRAAEDRGHWAFQRPVRPAVPNVDDTCWVQTPIDAFVLARLEAEGLQPNSPADRGLLVRRAAWT